MNIGVRDCPAVPIDILYVDQDIRTQIAHAREALIRLY